MKRRIITISAWVLAGVLANTLMTWMLALYAPFWPFISTHNDVRVEQEWEPSLIAWWSAHDPFDSTRDDSTAADANRSEAAAPIEGACLQTVRASGFELISISGTMDDGGASAVSAQRVRIGWPMKAMTATRWRLLGGEGNLIEKHDGGASVRLYSRSKEQRQWDAMLDGRIVPFVPIAIGFAANSIFYAGGLCVVLSTPFVIRRRRRIKRGLCGACGFDPGSGNVCGECGKPRPMTLGLIKESQGEVKLDERLGERIRMEYSIDPALVCDSRRSGSISRR